MEYIHKLFEIDVLGLAYVKNSKEAFANDARELSILIKIQDYACEITFQGNFKTNVILSGDSEGILLVIK